ncbi:50S ribosomal protein L18 [Candidatus Uhrbacteria bacterium]|nr:50S ribosomal protein L18 [Candidatus Uhrbacteria bacterium]
MNKNKAKQEQRVRRTARVRAKVTGTSEKPRLAVFRSLKHIRVQVIDDQAQKTLVSASDTELKNKKGTKVEQAHELGKLVAERAKAAKINKVVFDRRDKRYHGRVKAVADGAREGGLDF